MTSLRPAASTILICRDGGQLRLLWVRRSEANPFLGGFHSFPGGRYAHEDGPLGDDPDANLRTMARCAARETFEETGLLVGFHGSPPPLGEQRRHRRDVLDGKAVADDIEAKLRTTWNVLTQRRSNGGIVIVASRLDGGEDLEATRTAAQNFMTEALPHVTALLARTRNGSPTGM